MKIFDLKKQFNYLKKTLMKNVKEILSSGSYILGNNVKLIRKRR